ncbi:Na+/H+ antiporter NhaA [Sphingomonas kyeonggiensis]|uniref:Na(+)/H(+) antiporter NhaA n=1 Tax=Sphingomonas kyeonggiensis TaxID=1268553 RepID=A0A7W6JWV2_9SPHN|nr:Na+/H+ antiporter NhaA [Sphingomonas kyeonggiensis]MBB4099905.1 NhaA family Na+:H+ antiporter [Sphingomonas kyeonggiensis]
MSRIAAATRAFIASEAAGGVVLMAASALALVVANSPLAGGYAHLLHMGLGPLSLHGWINDALMAVFFLLVGLEIKAEVVEGQLSSWSQRTLPVIAAASGMAVPAIVYLAVAGGGFARGWAIPAATDIAFAMGLMALLGRHAPASLKLLLTTIAVVDDMGAVAIIALAYTAKLDLLALAGAGVVLAAMLACNRMRVTWLWPYLALAVLLWLCVFASGVHATIAGVAAALAIPRAAGLKLEHALNPWVAFAIVPLFGLANAGVALPGWQALLAPLPLAVALGLFLGKQVGVFGSIWLAVKAGIAPRPHARWGQIYGMALLAGIGFTMSLFIGGLAFPPGPLTDQVKIGVLAGSVLSALLGYFVLRSTSTATTSTANPPSESSAPTQPVDVQP